MFHWHWSNHMLLLYLWSKLEGYGLKKALPKCTWVFAFHLSLSEWRANIYFILISTTVNRPAVTHRGQFQYRICLNPMTSHSYLTSISVAQFFRHFVQGTAASLPCSVQNFKTIGLPIDKLWAFYKIWIDDELEMDFQCYNVVPILRSDTCGAVTITLQWPAHVLCLNHFSAVTSTRVTLHPISDPGAPLVIPLPPLDGCQHSK